MCPSDGKWANILDRHGPKKQAVLHLKRRFIWFAQQAIGSTSLDGQERANIAAKMEFDYAILRY
jgi:nitrous oxide reductase accessory protein NosL